MSPYPVHQSEFSNVLIQNLMTVEGLFSCVAWQLSINSHQTTPTQVGEADQFLRVKLFFPELITNQYYHYAIRKKKMPPAIKMKHIGQSN